jgi:hypothetical protein
MQSAAARRRRDNRALRGETAARGAAARMDSGPIPLIARKRPNRSGSPAMKASAATASASAAARSSGRFALPPRLVMGISTDGRARRGKRARRVRRKHARPLAEAKTSLSTHGRHLG